MGTTVMDHRHITRPRISIEATIYSELVVVLAQAWCFTESMGWIVNYACN